MIGRSWPFSIAHATLGQGLLTRNSVERLLSLDFSQKESLLVCPGMQPHHSVDAVAIRGSIRRGPCAGPPSGTTGLYDLRPPTAGADTDQQGVASTEKAVRTDAAKKSREDYPSPGWDSILQRVLKICSSPKRMAVNLPLFEQPVSSG